MAEFVQMRLEKWSPILGEATRIGLLNKEETMEIVKQIQKWEYTMQKSTRSLANVLGYVEYQTGILKELKRKREELQITEKTFEIETGIKNRIRSLYGTYETNFYNKLDYWYSLLAFNLGHSSILATTKCFENAYKRIGKQYPVLFEKASTYVWKQENKDIETARLILQEGVRSDEKNLDFYLWMYELELKHASYLLSKRQDPVIVKGVSGSKSVPINFNQQQDAKDWLKCVEASTVAYKAALDFCWNIKDCTVKLYTRFLEIAYKYPQFENQASEIMRDLERNCPDQEETYIKLAEMEFLNKNNLEECIAKLEKGTNTVKTEKMYDLAIHYLVKLLTDKPRPLIYTKLHTMLNNGLEKDAISKESFAIWFNMFLSKNKTCLSRNGAEYNSELFSDKEEREIVPLASSKYSDDIQLQLEVLKIKINSKIWSPKDIDETILSISNTTRVKNLSGVDMKKFEEQLYGYVVTCVENYVVKFDENVLVRIRKIMEPFFINNPVLVKRFVNLIHLRAGNIVAFRHYFTKNSFPPSYELLRTYAEIEFKNMNYNLEPEARYSPFREMMEKACLSYGNERTDVWIDYINFEKILKNDKAVSDIYSRGLKTVDKSKKERLQQGYNQLFEDC